MHTQTALGTTRRPSVRKPGGKLLRNEEKQVPAALFVSGTKALAAARMVAAAEWIRTRRLQFGMNQSEAAADLGIPLRQLATYEAVANWPKEARDFVSQNSDRLPIAALTRQIANRKWANKAALMTALHRLADGFVIRRRTAAPAYSKSPDIMAIENRIRDRLQTRIDLSAKGRGGTLKISFSSLEELERILAVLQA